MESSSIIIGIGFLLLFMGPIIYIILHQMATEKKHLKKLNSICTEYQMTPKHYEILNDLILGLDKHVKKLVIAEPKNNMRHTIVDLSQVDHIEISRKILSETNGNKKKDRIIGLSLDLIENQSENKFTKIAFYNEDDNESFDPEVRLFTAQKWKKLIQENLS